MCCCKYSWIWYLLCKYQWYGRRFYWAIPKLDTLQFRQKFVWTEQTDRSERAVGSNMALGPRLLLPSLVGFALWGTKHRTSCIPKWEQLRFSRKTFHSGWAEDIGIHSLHSYLEDCNNDSYNCCNQLCDDHRLETVNQCDKQRRRCVQASIQQVNWSSVCSGALEHITISKNYQRTRQLEAAPWCSKTCNPCPCDTSTHARLLFENLRNSKLVYQDQAQKILFTAAYKIISN